MDTLRRTPWMLWVFVAIGGVFGGLLGEILLRFSSSDLLRSVFLKGPVIGLTPPFTLDLFFVTLTLGFTLHIHLLIILGMVLGLVTFKQM